MKEAEIRPQALFDEYLALCRTDAETFFYADEWEDVTCPACGAAGEPAFTKHGFRYVECASCDTLYASPRPAAVALARYYRESRSVRFWATDFYRETQQARRALMFAPRAAASLAAMREALSGRDAATVIDIGAGYGVFCEEIRGQQPAAHVCAIEPSPALAEVLRSKGFRVIERFLEDLQPRDLADQPGPRLFTSFELFEHLHTPRRFLETCRRLMGPEDLLLLTTLSGRGLDIQVLWERAKAVFPPHHLNFLNPASLDRLARDCGFRDVQVTTPGRLDVDILSNHAAALDDHRFLRTVLGHGSAAALAELQQWLQRHGFSSHMMMVARVGGSARVNDEDTENA